MCDLRERGSKFFDRGRKLHTFHLCQWRKMKESLSQKPGGGMIFWILFKILQMEAEDLHQKPLNAGDVLSAKLLGTLRFFDDGYFLKTSGKGRKEERKK